MGNTRNPLVMYQDGKFVIIGMNSHCARSDNGLFGIKTIKMRIHSLY